MAETRPLSVQLYSVRQLLPADRDGVLGRLAQAGYTAIEPFQPTEDPHGVRRVATELGLDIPSLHARALVDGDAEAVFEAALVLGTRLVIVPAGIAPEQFATTAGVAAAADTLNALAERAAEHGLALGYHNHWWEIEQRVDGEHALEALAGLLEPEVALELDVYWAAAAGADVLALLDRLGERVRALHLKDGPAVRDEPQTALGKGVLPLPEILAAAPEALRVVELDECATDTLEALAASRAYLSSLEAE